MLGRQRRPPVPGTSFQSITWNYNSYCLTFLSYGEDILLRNWLVSESLCVSAWNWAPWGQLGSAWISFLSRKIWFEWGGIRGLWWCCIQPSECTTEYAFCRHQAGDGFSRKHQARVQEAKCPKWMASEIGNYHLCQIKVSSSLTFSLLARMDVGFLP